MSSTVQRKTRILMLGAGLMQIPAMRAADELGWDVIATDANPRSPGAIHATIFEPVDISDPPAILELARRYYTHGGLDGVFTAGTDFSATVAWVAQHLDLPGIPYETALDASIKTRMRRKFKDANVPSPRFVELLADNLLPEQAVTDLSYPFVVKPVDNMGARGVSKVGSPEALAAAVALARKYSRTGVVIVEEFIEGNEYSIDSLVYDGKLVPCGIADRHIYFPPYFIELGHTIPTSLGEKQIQELVEVFTKAVKAVGISIGAAKGDVFYGPDGPVIGEIAARLSGGYMSGWTYPLASGVDLTKAALLLAIGKRPDAAMLSPLRFWTTAERAIVSIPGVVKSVDGVDSVKAIDGVAEVFLRVKPGDHVVFPTNNVEKAGNVIVSRSTRKEAVDVAEKAVSGVVVRLEQNQASTENFLTASTFFGSGSVPEGAWPACYPKLAALLQSEGQVNVWSVEQLAEKGVWDYHSLGELLATPEVQALKDQNDWVLSVIARGGYQAVLYAQDTLVALSPDEAEKRKDIWKII